MEGRLPLEAALSMTPAHTSMKRDGESTWEFNGEREKIKWWASIHQSEWASDSPRAREREREKEKEQGGEGAFQLPSKWSSSLGSSSHSSLQLSGWEERAHLSPAQPAQPGPPSPQPPAPQTQRRLTPRYAEVRVKRQAAQDLCEPAAIWQRASTARLPESGKLSASRVRAGEWSCLKLHEGPPYVCWLVSPCKRPRRNDSFLDSCGYV